MQKRTLLLAYSLPRYMYYTLCLGYICPDRRTSFLVCDFPYDFPCDFPYDFSDIVDDNGLRRTCLQYIRTSYDSLLLFLSYICPDRHTSFSVYDFPYDFSDIVDDHGLRCTCLQYIRTSYYSLLLYYTLCLSYICPDRHTSF